ncbi:MAG: Ohr family peroxiredoxin [Acholeplasmatales bacterium]|nr:MAG: Ohr family peroxiredoxin [Acholeplasmatales bacterium]
MKTFLSRRATVRGGRDGTVEAHTSKLVFPLSKPEEMGGKLPAKTNPEELFAAGYAACFASSLEYLLNEADVAYTDLEVTASTALVADGAEGFKFAVTLTPRIAGLAPEEAEAYIEQALAFCPYSKAIKGNVEVTIKK